MDYMFPPRDAGGRRWRKSGVRVEEHTRALSTFEGDVVVRRLHHDPDEARATAGLGD